MESWRQSMHSLAASDRARCSASLCLLLARSKNRNIGICRESALMKPLPALWSTSHLHPTLWASPWEPSFLIASMTAIRYSPSSWSPMLTYPFEGFPYHVTPSQIMQHTQTFEAAQTYGLRSCLCKDVFWILAQSLKAKQSDYGLLQPPALLLLQLFQSFSGPSLPLACGQERA